MFLLPFVVHKWQLFSYEETVACCRTSAAICVLHSTTEVIRKPMELGSQFLLIGGQAGGPWIPVVHLLLLLSHKVKEDVLLIR
jgi:hypothetical protein